MQEIHVGDIGTVFIFTVYDESSQIVDLSTATQMSIIFHKPDGSRLKKTPLFYTDGKDGKIKYTAVSGDLNMQGTWQIQAILTFSSGKWSSNVGSFTVYANVYVDGD